MNSAIFSTHFRVYYEDTDAAGVVYYANYLKFFERARTEWLRALGISQQQLAQETRTAFMVVRSTVDYLQSAKLDDVLQITCAITQRGRASIEFAQTCQRVICPPDKTIDPGLFSPTENNAHPIRPPQGPTPLANSFETQLLAQGQTRVCCVSLNTMKPIALPGSVAARIDAYGSA